ncbi:hypothetical protein VTI74DRAFT_6048 [Chaetomium olivicolor]
MADLEPWLYGNKSEDMLQQIQTTSVQVPCPFLGDKEGGGERADDCIVDDVYRRQVLAELRQNMPLPGSHGEDTISLFTNCSALVTKHIIYSTLTGAILEVDAAAIVVALAAPLAPQPTIDGNPHVSII